MKVIDVIELINGIRTMPDVAKELGLSKDTLRRRLNSVGYKYDNSLKKTIYKGKESEKNQIDDTLVSDLIQKKNVSGKKNIGKKSEEVQKKSKSDEKDFRKESDENQKEGIVVNVIREKSEGNQKDFTESEIFALKELVSTVKSDEVKLFLELASLPESNEIKKSSIVISKDIHDQFEEFAKKFSSKRISKFSLIELALYEFMHKYN
ncbi:hypothetical protein [Bacillus wiedmannii]|uniref:hypothetical protein n=1 Tax=Bacillus wiedmannii TaxID=1890302 RepID=UPI0020CF17F9|nr:hypothetical protein [Bacillus wiedmannii]MCP9282338.1 hypothetical protein [Bacillus wiedmannii]